MNSKPRRILVVENHPDSAAMLAKLLQSKGHTVTTAATCAAARAAFKSAIFDVAVIDVGLPDGDGCDLFRELRAIRIIPALAVSGYGMADDVQRTQTAGFVAHILKPVDLLQLEDLISNVHLSAFPA